MKNKPLDVGKVREARQVHDSQGHLERGGDPGVLGKDWREPVTVKWVDTDKGEDGRVAIRSCLIARDFRT